MDSDIFKPDPNAALVLSLRLKGAAKALGISDRTLWTWTQAGNVPHVRIGGTILYPVDSLRRWLNEQSKATSASTQAAGCSVP